MATSLLADAFAHHVWATQQVIDACAVLTAEQLTADSPGTYGPVIETLRHICGSDTWYLSHFRAARTNPAGTEKQASLAALRDMITRNGEAWVDLLAGDVDSDALIIERQDEGTLRTAVGIWLTQVVHHGTDHRSQVCTALTSMGIEPPEIDVWAYARASGRELWEPR